VTGEGAAGERGTIDWLAIATALLFAMNGVDLVVNSETPLLRLAVLGLPGWSLGLVALTQLGLAAMLVSRSTRFYGALGLAVVAAITLGLHFAYREPRAAMVAGGELVVVLILLVASRRPRGDRRP
jgi:hypothetical protein